MKKILRDQQVPIAVTKEENEMIVKLAKLHEISKTEAIIQAVKFATDYKMP